MLTALMCLKISNPSQQHGGTRSLKSVDIWKDLAGNQADVAKAFLHDHGNTDTTK